MSQCVVGDPDTTPYYSGPVCNIRCVPIGACSQPLGHKGQHVAGTGRSIIGVLDYGAVPPAAPPLDDEHKSLSDNGIKAAQIAIATADGAGASHTNRLIGAAVLALLDLSDAIRNIE